MAREKRMEKIYERRSNILDETIMLIIIAGVALLVLILNGHKGWKRH